MKLARAITFCIFYSFVLGYRDRDEPSTYDEELDVKRYKEELTAGHAAEFLGQHHHEPPHYESLARRFVPVYPYKDPVESEAKEKDDLEEILKYIMVQPAQKDKKDQVKEIIPVRAPPEIVLAVMRNATQSEPSQPSDPTEEVIRQYMLRSGDYWDSVWTEEGNQDNALRSNTLDKDDSDEDQVNFKNAVPISAKLVPGSKLFDLVSGIFKKAPQLVYIINEDSK